MAHTLLLAKTSTRTKFSIFRVLSIFCLVFGFGVSGAMGQQVIGTFPSQDGGFEGQTTGALGSSNSTTAWWLSSSLTGTINSTGGRSGPKSANISMSGTSHRTLRGPATQTFAAATAYVIQFYYKGDKNDDGTSDYGDIRGGINGSAYAYGSYTTNANTGSNWVKYTASVTPGAATSSGHAVVSIIEASGKTAVFDIDDVVIYAGSSADVSAANSPGTVTVNNPTTTSLDLSWVSATGGVDGGGYVVVRYSSSPIADNDPNQNGIYAVGNTHTNGTGSLVGTVRYIGTGTSFTDNVGLAAGTQYWYKVYTVDKAFNYSAEVSGNGTTTAAGPSTDANLSAFTTAATGFTPTFAAATTAYDATTTFATATTTVTATRNQAAATLDVRVNGGSYTSLANATASGALALNVGVNTIDVRVTAEDLSTTKTYTLTVTRAAAATNANLSALTTTASSFSPTFASGTIAYTASVLNGVTSTTVTPTKADAGATIQVQVNGGGYATVSSGSASSALPLNVGSNAIDVLVTAEDGSTTKTYTITVTRATASSPTLNAVTLSSALSTTYGTASSGLSFTASGSNLTGNITATAQSGYLVSSDNLTFTSSVSVASGSPVYVAFSSACAAGPYNGTTAVVLSSTGATDANVTTSASGNTVSQKALTINNLTAQNKVYDGLTSATVTGTAALVAGGVVNADVVALSGTPSFNFSSAAVGTGKTINTTNYTLSGAGSGNYSLTQPSFSADITVRNLTITANDVSKVAGVALTGGAGSVAFSSSGLQNSETIGTVTIAYGSAGATTGDGNTAGVYASQVIPSDATAGTFTAANYSISYVAGSITVTAAPVTLAAWNFFGESSPATSTADVSNANFSSTPVLVRGAGAASSSGGNSFRTTGFQNNGIATSNTDYFQTAINSTNGIISLSTLDAKVAGTASYCVSPGVSQQFAYSLDGTIFTLIGSVQSTVGSPGTLTQINLSNIPALQNVSANTTITLRYYASGQTTTGGWGFSSASANSSDDGFTIKGSVKSAPSLSTPTATSITDVSATLGATVTADGGSSITARGTSYKTSSPVIASDNQLAEGGTSVAAYTHSRTGLSPQTQYFYTGYATNTTGTALSTEGSFRTLSTAPTVQASGVSATTVSASQIDLSISAATFPSSGATQGGYVVIYSTGTPTLSSSNGAAPAAGVGSIFATNATVLSGTQPSTTINVTGLSTATAYNFLVVPYTWDGTNAATYNYLTSSAPTANATTNSGPPTLTTPTATTITENAAILGATVTSNGGSALTFRGTSYKTSSPVIATDNQLAEGGTTVAAYSHLRTSLNPETQYFYVGYATNSTTTSLSSEGSFRTLSNPPTVQAGLSATASSTTQINLTITAATFPTSGATQAGYVVIYATGTPTFTATNGQIPSAGVGSIFATNATILPSAPGTTVNITGLTQSTLYNFLVIPYTWDGTNASTYHYLTTAIPAANATTLGPVNIAIQDFEASPATPTISFSNTLGSNSTGDNGTGGLPASANLFVSGIRGWQAINQTSVVTFGNQSLIGYTNSSFNFRLAGMSVSATNGIDGTDVATVAVSVDGGSTYSNELTIAGSAASQRWDFTATGTTTITYDGDNTPTAVTSSSGSGGISTVTVNIPNSNTQVRVRVTLLNNSSDERWVMDDFKIVGSVNTTPTIIRTPSSLSGFTQNSATPSAEQNYTVSGLNLTNDVSITPPTGYEISTTTGGSFSATNPIVLTQTGGNLVGEPVTIYVRQNSSTLGSISGNITHTSTGASNVNTGLLGTRTGTYYYDGSGDLDVLTNWGLNTDGTGTNPSNFTSAGIIYEIRNAATATIGDNWVVSGSSSKVVVGDGTNATDFTIPSGFTLTGTIDVSNAAELTIEHTSAPTFGTFATNSTLEYNNVVVTLSSAITYRNLKLSGTGTKTFPGGTTTIAGNLTLNGTTLIGSGSNPFSTISLAGDLTYIGTVLPPADANSITLSTNGTAAGTQTFTGAGNTLRWFRIQTTTANTILLSTTGGSSNVLLGNATGGGLTLLDGSILNMNGNDFQLFNGGASFNLNATGSISTTSLTDFNLERTTSGSLGTLRFTSGSNAIGNLTLNHIGTTKTLTLGSAVNVTGVVTITSGTLNTGGFLTLISSATADASIAAIGAGGSISGDVTVQRFVPGTIGRKYRYLAAPFATGPTIANSWQQQIHITGNGTGGTACPTLTAHSNGFDASTFNNPSMIVFDEVTATVVAGTPNVSGATIYTNAWKGVANTASTNLIGGKGYSVFVRGSRAQGCGLLDGTNPTPNDVTLSATGTITTGNFNYTVTYNSSNGEGWNLVGNPYPSAIDWNAASWTKTNLDASIWIYRPSNDQFAVYNGVTGTNGGSNIIASGQAFFVKANAASPALIATEGVKTSSNPSPLLLKNKPFEIRLTLANSLGKTDESVLSLNRALTDGFDQSFDAEKMNNPSNVNIYSIDALNKKYAINGIAVIEDEQEKLIPLGIGAASAGNYSLNLNAQGLPSYYQVFLRDHYLHRELQLMVDSSLSQAFTVSSDSASFGNLRFDLFIKNNRPHSTGLNSSTTAKTEVNVFPNPTSNLLTVSIKQQGSIVGSLVLFNSLGQAVKTISHPPNEVVLDLGNFEPGIYFLQVNSINEALKTIKVVKH